MVTMQYRQAIEKLQTLAAACESVKSWPPGDPFLREAYIFGDVLRGADPLEFAEVIVVVNVPPPAVAPWASSPQGAQWAGQLGLSTGGFRYWWRSHLDPWVWDDRVPGPVRFWSQDGTDVRVLRALAERRFADLPRQAPSTQARGDQLAARLEAALSRLRDVYSAYWDEGWRREHRGDGRNPENELWEAVDSYLELLDAADPRPDETAD
jgi:hypothetical protein